GRRAGRDRAPHGRVRTREPLLPAPHVRGLAVLGVHDGAREERPRVRGHDRRHQSRHRRRRVRPAVVDQGGQEDTGEVLHPRVGHLDRRARPQRARDFLSSLAWLTWRLTWRRVTYAATPAPAAAPAANATARVRRRGAGSDATPSRIDCSFVCSGCHPSARSRSFAITHGWTRYGTTPGGISPIPSDHVARNPRVRAVGEYAGTNARGR